MNFHVVVHLADFQASMHPLLEGLVYEVTGLPVQRDDLAAPEHAKTRCIVVELTLPNPKCLALIRRMAQLHPRVGLIVTDTGPNRDNGAKAYASGADVCRTDAVPGWELLAIANALRRRLPAPAHQLPLEVPSMVLDTARRELHGPAGTVSLADSQCKLLRAFGEAANARLRSSDIHKVFGYGEHSDPNLSVPMGRVRQRLTQAGAGPKSIISLRGQGYQLICPLQIH